MVNPVAVAVLLSLLHTGSSACSLGIYTGHACECPPGLPLCIPEPSLLNLSACETYVIHEGSRLSVRALIPPRKGFIVGKHSEFIVRSNTHLVGSVILAEASKMFVSGMLTISGSLNVGEKSSLVAENVQLNHGALVIDAGASLFCHGARCQMAIFAEDISISGNISGETCTLQSSGNARIETSGVVACPLPGNLGTEPGGDVTGDAKSILRVEACGNLLIDGMISGEHIAQDYEYMVSTERMSWDDHEAAAKQWGGHLASINSAEENHKIFSMVQQMHIDCFRIWIGGKRNNETWEWSDGNAWSFDSWSSGEPNGAAVAEDNVCLYQTSPHWDDFASLQRLCAVYKRAVLPTRVFLQASFIFGEGLVKAHPLTTIEIHYGELGSQQPRISAGAVAPYASFGSHLTEGAQCSADVQRNTKYAASSNDFESGIQQLCQEYTTPTLDSIAFVFQQMANFQIAPMLLLLFFIVLRNRPKLWSRPIASNRPISDSESQNMQTQDETMDSNMRQQQVTSDNGIAPCINRTPFGYVGATSTNLAYSVEEIPGNADGELAISVNIQCPGVDMVEVCLITDGLKVEISRPSGFGQPELIWTKRFQFSDGMEFRADESSLENGVFCLIFRKQQCVIKFQSMTRSVNLGEVAKSLPRMRTSHEAPPAVAGDNDDKTSTAGSFQLLFSKDLVSTDGSDDRVAPPKCYLPNTAFKSPDGHLLLVQNVQEGAIVVLSDGGCASVASIKQFPLRKKPYSVCSLSTSQGTFEVSSSHRIAVPGGETRADQLKDGDVVLVGLRERQLLHVTEKQVRTALYMVSFNPDGIVEAFPVSTLGIQTKGEPLPHVAVAGTDDQHQRTTSAQGTNESTFAFLNLIGAANVTEADLENAMPTGYED